MCCEEDSAYGGSLETRAQGFSHLSSFPQFRRGALLVYGRFSRRRVRDRTSGRVKGEEKIKERARLASESPGPFNTIRTSGYHHGLFDSPFCRASRNVFFLPPFTHVPALFLLVSSIHLSSVRARSCR